VAALRVWFENRVGAAQDIEENKAASLSRLQYMQKEEKQIETRRKNTVRYENGPENWNKLIRKYWTNG
jgi:hypothetical protein